MKLAAPGPPAVAVLGVRSNDVLGHYYAGLNNMKDALYTLCRQASEKRMNISYETLRWNARVPNHEPYATIPHTTLWDVEHWNRYVAKHGGGLPYLVRDQPTMLVPSPEFSNELFLNTFYESTQTPAGSLRVAHFHRALQPHTSILKVAEAAMPRKPYGAVHLRIEDDLNHYPRFVRGRLGVKTYFDLMAKTTELRACALGVSKLYVAVGLNSVTNSEDKSLLLTKKGPFGTTLVLHEDLDSRFGQAAFAVGAIVDEIIVVDAAYYVGHAGFSTFDRAVVDRRATRDQWHERMAVPDNCTFTIVRYANGTVSMRRPEFRHLPSLPNSGINRKNKTTVK